MSRMKPLRMTMRTTLEALAAVNPVPRVLVVLETLISRNLVALIPLCLPVWAQAAKEKLKELKVPRERRYVVLVLDHSPPRSKLTMYRMRKICPSSNRLTTRATPRFKKFRRWRNVSCF